jgi:hypothetical protein
MTLNHPFNKKLIDPFHITQMSNYPADLAIINITHYGYLLIQYQIAPAGSVVERQGNAV